MREPEKGKPTSKGQELGRKIAIGIGIALVILIIVGLVYTKLIS